MGSPRRRHSKKRPARNASRHRELSVVRTVTDAIRCLPTFRGPADISVAEAAREKIEKIVGPIWNEIATLHTRWIPEAQVPHPCGDVMSYGTRISPYLLRWPIENLIVCRWFCGPCREEGQRAFAKIQEGITTGTLKAPFASPKILRIRIEHADRLRIAEAQRETEGQPLSRLEWRPQSRPRAIPGSWSPQPTTSAEPAGGPKKPDAVERAIMAFLTRNSNRRWIGAEIAEGTGLKISTIKKRLQKMAADGHLDHMKRKGYLIAKP